MPDSLSSVPSRAPGAGVFAAAGLAAAGLYVTTLCTHWAPGLSAYLVASHRGTNPFAPVDFPLWGLLMRALGSASPALVNGTSAILGALVVGLAALLCARLAHNRSHEERRSSLSLHRSGLLSGLIAAAALATSPPYWFAATRALPEMFGLGLLLGVACLWLGSMDLRRRWWIYPASLLTGVGCVENATFFVALPAFLGLAVAHALRRRRLAWKRLGACAALFLLGYGLILLAAWTVWRSPSAAWRGFDSFGDCLLAVFRQQKVLLAVSIPRVGWLLLALTSLLPLLMALMPKERLQSRNPWPSYLLHAGLTALAAILLSNQPISVYRMFLLDPLIIAPSLVNALWIGYLAGYWWSVAHSHSRLESPMVARVKRACAWGWPVLAAALMLAVGWRNLGLVHPRHTAWTDAYADHLLEQLPERAVLLTETPMDDVIRLKAAGSGRRVSLVSPSKSSASAYLGYLGAVWESPRLRSLVAVGSLQVAAEWIRTEPADAAARLRSDYYDGPMHATGATPVLLAPFYRPGADGSGADRDKAAAALQDWESRPYLRQALESDAPESFAYFSGWLRHSAAKFANNLGVDAEAAGRADLAERHYRLARKWNPRNLSALLNLADLSSRLGLADAGELQAELKRFIEDTLGDARLSLLNLNQSHSLIARPDAYVQRGLAWAVTGKPLLAAGEIRRAMELSEQSDRLRTFLAFAQFEGGHAEEAEATVREVLAKDPLHATALAQLARLQAGRGDFVSARATMARAVEAQPGVPALRLQQAGVEMLGADPDAALAIARSLTQAHPAFVEGWALLAHLAHQAGDRDLVRLAEQALRLGGQLPPAAHIVLADLRAREGDLAAARDILERAVRVHRGHAGLLEQLLRTAHQQRDRRLARQVVADLLRVDPTHAYGNLILGSLHHHDRELAYAEAAYRASLDRHPNPEAYNSLAFALYEQGRYREALTLADQADALRPDDPLILDTRAMVLFGLNRLSEARPLARRAVERDPGNAELLLHLATILDASGEGAEALTICDELFARVGEVPPHVQTDLVDLRAKLRERVRAGAAAP